MNLNRIATILFVLLSGACTDPTEETEQPSRECMISIDSMDFSFGIDYSDTLAYLAPGTQSDLDDKHMEEVRNSFGTPEKSIGDIVDFCHWMDRNFTFENAGGGMVGKVDVNDLFEAKAFYGCHSAALIISSVLRKFGFPVIMIETFDVQWAYAYHDRRVDHFAGHVMSEVYVENSWILLDNNGSYIRDYDPLNPYILAVGQPRDEYFVFAKGLDTWDYIEGNESFTHDRLIFYSENIYCFEEMFDSVRYNWIR